MFGGGSGFDDYDDGDDGGGGGMVCVFGGEAGAVTAAAAAVVGGSSLACVVPRGVAPGFVSVGISGNRGVDAKFFHYDEVMVSFAGVGEMTAAVGPGVWARGDSVFVAGTGMIPREANAAVVGQSLPCGWWAQRGAETAASSGGGSPGTFVSSALRQCEAPVVTDFSRVVAMTEPAWGGRAAWHAGGKSAHAQTNSNNNNKGHQHLSAPSSGPVIAVAEPPRVVGVQPGATTAEGGGVLVLTTTGGGAGVSAGSSGAHHRVVVRIGTTRVAVDAAPSGGDSWRCVAPAHGLTLGDGGGTPEESASLTRRRDGAVDVALLATHFGSGASEGTWATTIRFVSAPRAGLVGGPPAGAADAAVPTATGALFRLFFSSLLPRSLMLWCVVGGASGGNRQGLVRLHISHAPNCTRRISLGHCHRSNPGVPDILVLKFELRVPDS